ncbi:hypothetical protein ASE60_28960 [Ensifer sp. Root278]|nr:hypothetical protein ASE60_28960 [Ensifer sp. Root278]
MLVLQVNHSRFVATSLFPFVLKKNEAASDMFHDAQRALEPGKLARHSSRPSFFTEMARHGNKVSSS